MYLPTLRGPAKHSAIVLILMLSALASADETEDTLKLNTELEEESPWLLIPILSSDPKLGSNLGAVAGYIKAFDEKSTPSMIVAFGTYSDTDSHTAGLFGDMYFDNDTHKVKTGLISGRIRNEYDDFLGTGVNVKTEDDMKSFFFRYQHRLSGDWYLGGQLVITNYAIGSDGFFDAILDQIGLTGFDSNGVGLVGEFDSRDHTRNPTDGNHFIASNVAYRESFGGEESFDAYQLNYTNYWGFGDGHVLATNARGRWTHSAPLGGYSSLNMRGYTRGNYLAEHYSHLNFDARFHIHDKWGASLFGGVGCLYEKISSCNDSESLFPMMGGGVTYTLKPKAGIVLRLEYAKGEGDNSAVYLSLGHPF